MNQAPSYRVFKDLIIFGSWIWPGIPWVVRNEWIATKLYAVIRCLMNVRANLPPCMGDIQKINSLWIKQRLLLWCTQKSSNFPLHIMLSMWQSRACNWLIYLFTGFLCRLFTCLTKGPSPTASAASGDSRCWTWSTTSLQASCFMTAILPVRTVSTSSSASSAADTLTYLLPLPSLRIWLLASLKCHFPSRNRDKSRTIFLSNWAFISNHSIDPLLITDSFDPHHHHPDLSHRVICESTRRKHPRVIREFGAARDAGPGR